MSNLKSISIPLDKNELNILLNEIKEKPSLSGSEVWNLVLKLNVIEILKEPDSKIISFLKLLVKYTEKCLLEFSEEQLKQWIMEINIIIICNSTNKNELIINEILEFNNTQLNILLENKEQEKRNVNYSEWIYNSIKFHEIFKNSNFESKLFEKYLKNIESLLILDTQHTNLNNEKESLKSLISTSISHNQYIRNKILDIIQLLIKYYFIDKECLLKGILHKYYIKFL
ncbi:hypothetical protein PIROE2DRAFT_7449 [Piromyces sp. E2]|nr:hypothetical protein PIROE2DRAFT_7449 [Piromyces sp. E2]|eukprot:OUM65518.1 hypothetical protein PIROE2DRAFT_7449 [Piromyces sp. E2]